MYTHGQQTLCVNNNNSNSNNIIIIIIITTGPSSSAQFCSAESVLRLSHPPVLLRPAVQQMDHAVARGERVVDVNFLLLVV